jgi:hypothetical protein
MTTIASKVTTLPESGGQIGVVLGATGTAGNHGMQIYADSSGHLVVDRNVSGTVTNLYTSSSTAVVNSLFYVSRVGGVVFVVCEGTSTDIRVSVGGTSGPYVGIFGKNTANGRLSYASTQFGVG